MFGKFRSERVRKDEEGKTIYKKKTSGQIKTDRQGNKLPEKKKVWITHEKGTDQGIFPSVNRMYTRMAKGRQKLIKPAEELFEEWHEESKLWALENEWQATEDDKVIVEVTAYLPNKNTRNRDVSNAFKLMLDAFEGTLYPNDKQALPRVKDILTVEEGVEPHFVVDVYKKEEELTVMRKMIGEAISDS